MVHRLSYLLACGIFPDQGSNPRPLHWQEESYHYTGPPGKFRTAITRSARRWVLFRDGAATRLEALFPATLRLSSHQSWDEGPTLVISMTKARSPAKRARWCGPGGCWCPCPPPGEGRPWNLPGGTFSASLTPPSVWPKGCAGCASEERLFHKLFTHYNQFIRPVENVSDPITVYFEVAITQLADVVSARGSPHTTWPQGAPTLRAPSNSHWLHEGK